MSKYNFHRATDDILSVRISKETADKIRDIAKNEGIAIQEVCRTFLTVALEDYIMQSHHNITVDVPFAPTESTPERSDT